MEYTSPLAVTELRVVYPRDTRAMADEELDALLRLEERALRTQFGVTSTAGAINDALADAMLAAWPSFLQQLRQVASEDAGADGYRVTYNRPGVIDFAFPAFIGTMLAGIADSAAGISAPSVTELVR